MNSGMTGSGKVTFVPAADVSAAFAKGMPLLETGGYKVHASRREEEGKVEVHEEDTDILYVLDGKATIVTGGAMTGGKSIGPGEIRGTGVDGGESRNLVKGDVMVIPNGVPHWFRSIKGPFLYYVVKVTAGGGMR